jgi:very-short-patch-repair endonuclease
MLREHFRCVPAIIEYSKREFYNHNLKPLRTPKQSEMLVPPLIDVLVEDGFRRKSINEAEATYIANKIQDICNNPNMSDRTIGVISLLGNEQAKRIEELLNDRITFEQKIKHKIKCGDALTFQGEERNIIFLSMVVTPNDCKANSGDIFSQRFNVASSRAKDRMYLVRSVTIEDLSLVDNLRINLIKHFNNPFGDNIVNTKYLIDACESKFEKDLYIFLTKIGYKVIPQFKVGNYRIDLVVEGNNDQKIAIECDGDNYHPSSKWEEDIKRQRILERAGWKFWRCFASTYYMEMEDCQNDLLDTLAKANIYPIQDEKLCEQFANSLVKNETVKVLVDA